ncbi:hypothetical protein K378_00893 [Streptomyces sp. Amel2xB2]|uniref:Uncharacterized protein n=1 Tax=Streptomyces nanshensis TaxID=518642 RepID=A0A1E7LCH9_9ACTN|nr:MULTISPECIES: DUF6412 domain-containing protein [Streptomyces]OEV13860.1 hypothetical protein AN218_01655 [Streptomyces nanshensis]RAJ69740.1 hypothetical protein K378_00893 [Streptomyces sp. Amel2xB2]
MFNAGTGVTLRAWRVHLSAAVLSFVGFLLTGAGLTTALTAAASSAAVVLVCRSVLGAVAVLAVAVPRVPSGRIRTAIRDRELRTAFLPQRDPDAAGRPRPRAPGRRVATAA